MRWEFWVYRMPVAQGRPRATVIRGGRIRLYDPQKSREWKRQVQLAALPVRPRIPSACPCRLTVEVLLPRPTRLTKHALYPVGRPDASNVLKGIEDALTQAGFWHDDSQIIDLSVSKRYGSPVGVHIIIEEIE